MLRTWKSLLNRLFEDNAAWNSKYQIQINRISGDSSVRVMSEMAPEFLEGRLKISVPESGFQNIQISDGDRVCITLPRTHADTNQLVQDFFQYGKFT